MVLVAKIASCPENLWMQVVKNDCRTNTMRSWIRCPSLHPYFKKHFQISGQRTSQVATTDIQAALDSPGSKHGQ